MTLGEKLTLARKKRGLTQFELAVKCGVSPTSIGLYERDKAEPSFFKLMCITDALNISLDWLAGRRKVE